MDVKYNKFQYERQQGPYSNRMIQNENKIIPIISRREYQVTIIAQCPIMASGRETLRGAAMRVRRSLTEGCWQRLKRLTPYLCTRTGITTGIQTRYSLKTPDDGSRCHTERPQWWGRVRVQKVWDIALLARSS